MTQHLENRTIDGAMELLKVNGFDALAEAVTVLLNSTIGAPSNLEIFMTCEKLK